MRSSTNSSIRCRSQSWLFAAKCFTVAITHSLYVSHGEPTGEIGIFAVALEISAPERSTVDVHSWPQNHVASQSFHFLTDRPPLALQQVGIPSRGHRHSSGERSRGHLLLGDLRFGLRGRSGPRPYADRAIRHSY